MWIKTQRGEYVNDDNLIHIGCRKSIGQDESHSDNVYVEDVCKNRSEIFIGTADDCQHLMDDIGRAIAAEKRYFDVMKKI